MMLAIAIITLAVLSGFAGSNFLTAAILGLSLAILTIANTHTPQTISKGGWYSGTFAALYGLCGLTIGFISFYSGKELALILGT